MRTIRSDDIEARKILTSHQEAGYTRTIFVLVIERHYLANGEETSVAGAGNNTLLRVPPSNIPSPTDSVSMKYRFILPVIGSSMSLINFLGDNRGMSGTSPITRDYATLFIDDHRFGEFRSSAWLNLFRYRRCK